MNYKNSWRTILSLKPPNHSSPSTTGISYSEGVTPRTKEIYLIYWKNFIVPLAWKFFSWLKKIFPSFVGSTDIIGLNRSLFFGRNLTIGLELLKCSPWSLYRSITRSWDIGWKRLFWLRLIKLKWNHERADDHVVITHVVGRIRRICD